MDRLSEVVLWRGALDPLSTLAPAPDGVNSPFGSWPQGQSAGDMNPLGQDRGSKEVPQLAGPPGTIQGDGTENLPAALPNAPLQKCPFPCSLSPAPIFAGNPAQSADAPHGRQADSAGR
jgi:hypothetical protein